MITKAHFWCAGLYAQGGGIEAYARDLLRALIGEVGEVKVFSKHDATVSLRRHLPGAQIGVGFAKVPSPARTAAFSAQIAVCAIIERPDLILCMHTNFTPVAAWLKRWFGISYILPMYGVEVWNLQHPSRQRGVAQADCLLPISNFTQKKVEVEQHLSPDRFRLLPCTFDAGRFSPGPQPEYLRERYALPAGVPVILSVSRLAASEAYKGQDRVIRVLSAVRQEVPDARYLIVGDGDDKSRLQRLVIEHGVANAVIFAGRVSDTELADHYRLCDLFALPSTGEGFGIVYLEAIACGKPCLGGNKDAAVDALCGGELGALVDPDNPAQLAAGIIAMLQRRHPNVMFYQPEALREKMLGYFSFAQFKTTLSQHLREWEQARQTIGRKP